MVYRNENALHANRYDVNKKQKNEITDIKMTIQLYDSENKNALCCSHETNESHRRKTTSRSANALFLLLRINYLLFRQLLLFILVMCSVSAKEQKFAMEPQDQSAVIGSRVTLPCRVVNKAGQLQWTKDDFGLGTHRHLVGYERYKMIGSDEEGDYSLDIQEVSLDDDAIYQCQVSSGPRGEPAIRSRYARLIVLVPPEPPRILQGSVLEAVEDREVNLECVSIGGKPAAEITWVDHEGGVITQGVTYTVEPLPDERRYTARSTLHLRPRRHHHNQTFTCQAQNTADRAYKASTITVQVQYAPRVRIYKKSGAGKLRVSESETLSLGCQAYANPSDLVYKWYINNQPLIENFNSELILPNVSRKYNGATVKCEAYNSVGKSADTKTLEVTYGPTFKIRPQNVEAEIGSVVTLHCIVEGNPAPKILWHRYEHNRAIIAGRSSNLTVTVSQRSTGQYVCTASVDGYKDVEAFVSVYLKGPPKITTNQSQYGMEGDSVRIECISLSIPKPDYVTWSFGGYEINSFNDREYAFLEETLADGLTKSTLIIRESKYAHFGTYNCSVTNIYGTDSVEIHLIPDKPFPLILIISAGASLAILLLIALLLVMLCHRKSKKSELVNKPDITDVGKTCLDQFKDRMECDRSSNISDLKLELRHVEGSCDMENSNGGSDTEFHSSLHLTSNLGLPLAGPVTLPDGGYDNELIKQYHRYSGDFNDTTSSLNFKVHSHSNGYVPYVDYSRDYAPPAQSRDSLNGSLSKSIDSSTYPMQCQPLNRQSSCGRLSALVGPDVIPMTNSGVFLSSGLDVRYAATYGNPYLRGSGPLSYVPQANTSNSSTTQAPPPYYSTRSNNLPLPMPPLTPPSSSSSSKPASSPQASSSSTNSGAQPQVPKLSSHSPGALYILPPSSQIFQANQITTKGKLRTGTHV